MLLVNRGCWNVKIDLRAFCLFLSHEKLRDDAKIAGTDVLISRAGCPLFPAIGTTPCDRLKAPFRVTCEVNA